MLIDPITVTVKRSGLGSHVDGRWLDVPQAPFTILADVQPMGGRELLNEAGGQREGQWLKLYTETPLQTADVDTGRRADVIAYQGSEYEAQRVTTWAAIGLDHYKVECRLINPERTV